MHLGNLEITQEATVELLTATPHTTHHHVHFSCALQMSSKYPQLNMYMLSMKQFFIYNNIIRGTLVSGSSSPGFMAGLSYKVTFY